MRKHHARPIGDSAADERSEQPASAADRRQPWPLKEIKLMGSLNKPDEKLVRPHWFWLHEAGESSTLTMPANEFFAEFHKAQRGAALLRFAYDLPLTSVGLDPYEDDDGWRPPLEPRGEKRQMLTRRASEKRTHESVIP